MVALVLHLGDPVLDHVTDTHDPGQTTVHEDGEVPDPALRHHCHELIELVLRAAGVHLDGHDRRHRAVEDAVAVHVQPPDHVPLTDDAVDADPVVRDHHGTDAVLGQEPEHLTHAPIRGDGDDRTALAPQHLGDPHGPSTPIAHARHDERRRGLVLTLDHGRRRGRSSTAAPTHGRHLRLTGVELAPVGDAGTSNAVSYTHLRAHE